MKIHFNNKEIDILVDTSSYRYTALQNVGTLYLYFASEEFINIPVGAYCIYKNITYYLMDTDDYGRCTQPENRTGCLHNRAADRGVKHFKRGRHSDCGMADTVTAVY